MTDSLIQTQNFSALIMLNWSPTVYSAVLILLLSHTWATIKQLILTLNTVSMPLCYFCGREPRRETSYSAAFSSGGQQTLLRAEEALKCFLLVCSSTHFWCRAPPRVNTVLHHKSGIHGHFKINRTTRMAQYWLLGSWPHLDDIIKPSYYPCPSDLSFSPFSIICLHFLTPLLLKKKFVLFYLYMLTLVFLSTSSAYTFLEQGKWKLWEEVRWLWPLTCPPHEHTNFLSRTGNKVRLWGMTHQQQHLS